MYGVSWHFFYFSGKNGMNTSNSCSTVCISEVNYESSSLNSDSSYSFLHHVFCPFSENVFLDFPARGLWKQWRNTVLTHKPDPYWSILERVMFKTILTEILSKK